MPTDSSATDTSRAPRLTYSREFFADYLTALISKIRQSADTDAIFTGSTKHPLIDLQLQNRTEILNLHIRLLAPEYLRHHPIVPADRFIALVETKSTVTPKLPNNWAEFLVAWPKYK